MSRSSNFPERPTKGSPARSSSRPGPSPTKSRSAAGLPTPNTTCVRPAANGHRVQVDAATRSRSSASASDTVAGAVQQDPRHARPDAADHLVADRPEEPRPVFRGDRLLTLRAEEHHLVAGPHGSIVAAVDHYLVHRDHAGQWATDATDQHLI